MDTKNPGFLGKNVKSGVGGGRLPARNEWKVVTICFHMQCKIMVNICDCLPLPGRPPGRNLAQPVGKLQCQFLQRPILHNAALFKRLLQLESDVVFLGGPKKGNKLGMQSSSYTFLQLITGGQLCLAWHIIPVLEPK